MTWMEGIKENTKKFNLKNTDTLNGVEWRRMILGNRPICSEMDYSTL